MVQQVLLALTQPHGNVCALPLKVHLLTCVNLRRPLPDEFVLAMLIPMGCQLLLPAVLLHWTSPLG